MRCQICKKSEATIHLTEINEGTRVEMHMCEQCAQDEGVSFKSQISVNELLSSLLAAQPADDDMFGEIDEQTSCPQCGITFEQFTKEAVLGCPNDYEVFDKVLSPIIKNAHDGKTTHCGKVPSKVTQSSGSKIELANLRSRLESAISKEDYELAAKLRDKISEIEKIS